MYVYIYIYIYTYIYIRLKSVLLTDHYFCISNSTSVTVVSLTIASIYCKYLISFFYCNLYFRAIAFGK